MCSWRRSVTELPARGVIATGSVRRAHQLRWLRPGLEVVGLRGNVPTRLRKLASNSWDAILLARAGLERLGFPVAAGEIEFEGARFRTTILSADDFLPAGGQGIVALQIRAEDEKTRASLAPLNHAPSLLCLHAEREFLRRLQGDCGTPVGVLAKLDSEIMTLRAQIFDEGETAPRQGAVTGAPDPEALAAKLWEQMNHGG